MPKRLLDRLGRDCIRGFRSAARERFIDGLEAEAKGRRTASIYLWGYAAEMTLKAAYFSAIGFSEARPIEFVDLRNARNAGIGVYRLDWPEKGKFHNIRAWAELLVEYRSGPTGIAYPTTEFGEEVKQRGRQIEPIWSETLRYHKNLAYRHEFEKMNEATRWLLEHSSSL